MCAIPADDGVVPDSCVDVLRFLTSLGSDQRYVVCTTGSVAASLTSSLSERWVLSSIEVDTLERCAVAFDGLLCEQVAGVMLDLRVFEHAALGSPSGSLDEYTPRWLQRVGVAELARIIDEFALHDAHLSARIGEAIGLRRRAEPFTELSWLGGLLEEFQDENTNLPLLPLINLAFRVAVYKEVEQVERVLTEAFESLQFGGRCLVITYHSWELKAVGRFLHEREDPSERALKTMLPQRLLELYPHVGSPTPYAVRRAAPLWKFAVACQQARFGMLHVLEKTPRSSAAGAAPACASPGALERFREPASVDLGRPGCPQPSLNAEVATKAQLLEVLAGRKMELQSRGLTLKQQKEDVEVKALNRRMRKLHRDGSDSLDKARKGCSGRQHVPVQLDDAIGHLTALGADGLYVDCTFGRGGHSRQILAKLSSVGRVQAFDI